MKIRLKDPVKFQHMLIMKGFTVRGFGRSIGISSPYIAQIVNGKRNPGPEIAKKIVDALDVEFEDIFFIEGADKSKQSDEATA